MTPTDQEGVNAYLTAFGRAAARLRLRDAGDIARDVRQHIEEAMTAGRDWPSVRATLGDPDVLAKAYAAELLFGSLPPDHADRPNLWALLGLATGGGVLTLIVTIFLGSIAAAFAFSAILLLVICLPIAFGAPTPVYVHLGGLSPWAFVLAAPVFGFIAWAAVRGLSAYLRWFATSLRRALPGKKA